MVHHPDAGSRYTCLLEIVQQIILLSIPTSEVQPVEDLAGVLVSPVLVILFRIFLQLPPEFFGFENLEARGFPID
jgi:hypothetical protein